MKTQDPFVVNGRRYSLWPKFVIGKLDWIGGQLEDLDPDARGARTTIVDISFEANGETSAVFIVTGLDFACASDVRYLAVDPRAGGDGWISFSGFMGHKWRIRQPENTKAFAV